MIVRNSPIKAMRELFSKCPQNATNAYWVVDNFQRVLVESALNIRALDSLYDIGAQAVSETLRLKSMNNNNLLTMGNIIMNQLIQSKESLQSCAALQAETTPLPDLKNLSLTQRHG